MKHTSQLTFTRLDAGTLLVHMSGTWKLGQHLPGVDAVWNKIDSDGPVKQMTFDTAGVDSWDSGLLNFLLKLFEGGASRKIEMDPTGLSEGVRRLLQLATAIAERKGARREVIRESLLVRVGSKALGLFESSMEQVGFLGEACLVFTRFLRGKAQFQRSEFLLILQDCGAKALSIVSLISLLVGLILAFVGAVQLMMFRAQIYVANLVAIAMTREMGAMMTGINLTGQKRFPVFPKGLEFVKVGELNLSAPRSQGGRLLAAQTFGPASLLGLVIFPRSIPYLAHSPTLISSVGTPLQILLPISPLYLGR